MKCGLLLVIFAALETQSYGQFLPDLQAKTPEEYDAYLDVLDGPVLDRGVVFEKSYPHSALLLPVYELIAREWRTRGNAEHAIEYVRKSVAIAPDYAPMLAELADLLASQGLNLDEAADAGRRALTVLDNIKAPRHIAVEEWTAAVGRVRSRAHGAIGLVLFRKDNVPGAIAEFEAAVAGAGPHEPSLHYRLGRLYVMTGRTAAGRKHLEEAARRGNQELRDLANTALSGN